MPRDRESDTETTVLSTEVDASSTTLDTGTPSRHMITSTSSIDVRTSKDALTSSKQTEAPALSVTVTISSTSSSTPSIVKITTSSRLVLSSSSSSVSLSSASLAAAATSSTSHPVETSVLAGIIGGIAGLIVLAGITIVFRRRKAIIRQERCMIEASKPDDTWDGGHTGQEMKQVALGHEGLERFHWQGADASLYSPSINTSSMSFGSQAPLMRSPNSHSPRVPYQDSPFTSPLPVQNAFFPSSPHSPFHPGSISASPTVANSSSGFFGDMASPTKEDKRKQSLMLEAGPLEALRDNPKHDSTLTVSDFPQPPSHKRSDSSVARPISVMWPNQEIGLEAGFPQTPSTQSHDPFTVLAASPLPYVAAAQEHSPSVTKDDEFVELPLESPILPLSTRLRNPSEHDALASSFSSVSQDPPVLPTMSHTKTAQSSRIPSNDWSFLDKMLHT